MDGRPAMMGTRRRWWLLRALRRGRIARTVDRAEAWTAIVGLLLLVLAVQPIAALAGSVHDANSAAFAREAATRHVVEAVALTPGKPATRGLGSAYQVQVQWFALNETRSQVVRVDRAVDTGARVPIWVDDDTGRVVTAPRTDADAQGDAIAVGVIVWLVTAAVGVGALAVLRRVLDRVRYRAWDRGLRALVDNDGGWATRNS